MKRIFIDKIVDNHIKLDPHNINYLQKTLRIKESTEIIVFDGEKEYSGIYNPKTNTIIIQKFIREKENAFLKLAIGEIKKPRLEWLIEKATELGVSKIFILNTERSQKYPNNLERFNKIAIEACKQCNRISIPIIQYLSLNQFLQQINKDEWVTASLNGRSSNVQKKGVIIGPEGGWTNEEEKLFTKLNIDFIKLGELILRSETAALTILAKLIL